MPTVRRTRLLARAVRVLDVTVPTAFPAVALVKGPSESPAYLFDFTPFPEFEAGLTLASVSVPAVAGLTIGPATLTTTLLDGVQPGKGATCVISGGTLGVTYSVSALGSFSDGSVREIRAALQVA